MTLPSSKHASAIAVSFIVALSACSSTQSPEPEHATQTSTSEAVGDETDREAQLAPIRTQITAMFCAEESPMRACFQKVPPPDKCGAFILGAWGGCEHIFPADLSQGDAAFWQKVGSDVTACIAGGFTLVFPPVESDQDKATCEAAKAKT